MILPRLLGASVLASAGIILGFAASTPAGAASASCQTATVALVDANLGIDAAHVTTKHAVQPVGALICSYYGNSGQSANEATINYVPATPKAFSAVETSLGATHSIRTIAGIKSGAYSYVVGSERFLYVLDGTEQIQMFATVPLVRLEHLAKAIPLLG